MAREYKQGWHGIRFAFGKSSPSFEEQQSNETRELQDALLKHIDELSYGGYRTIVDLDELDQN